MDSFDWLSGRKSLSIVEVANEQPRQLLKILKCFVITAFISALVRSHAIFLILILRDI
jgi:hypothetical protein